jgi:hypothetical protein
MRLEARPHLYVQENVINSDVRERMAWISKIFFIQEKMSREDNGIDKLVLEGKMERKKCLCGVALSYHQDTVNGQEK